jgi:hypothetical protein
MEEAMERSKALGTPYKDMPSAQKVKWVLKLIACICTFGMAFPNVMGE